MPGSVPLVTSGAVYADTGLFVCFEGGDGSGKSTQSRRLRDALTAAAARRVAAMTALGDGDSPMAETVDERAIVNAIVGLHATGGSTNAVLHLLAIAHEAGVDLQLSDFNRIADRVRGGRVGAGEFGACWGVEMAGGHGGQLTWGISGG